MKNVTLIKSEDGISSDGYNKQSSGWAPSWGAFNVAVGEAFTFQIAGRITITVTPDDTVQEDDVAYYYTVSDGNAIGGTFKFYESTGKAVLLMNGGPMQNARYTVSWSMNEDGTIRVGRLK